MARFMKFRVQERGEVFLVDLDLIESVHSGQCASTMGGDVHTTSFLELTMKSGSKISLGGDDSVRKEIEGALLVRE